MGIKNLFFLFVVLIFLSGCSRIVETTKVVWGSSTKALEEARVNSISKSYRCSFNDCFDAVINLKRTRAKVYRDDLREPKESEEEDDDAADEDVVLEVEDDGVFDIFINNRKKRHLVVMGIDGNVDTTEVGIFFSQKNLTTIKLEVSSLSSSAKRTAAEAIFIALDSQFSAVE